LRLYDNIGRNGATFGWSGHRTGTALLIVNYLEWLDRDMAALCGVHTVGARCLQL